MQQRYNYWHRGSLSCCLPPSMQYWYHFNKQGEIFDALSWRLLTSSTILLPLKGNWHFVKRIFRKTRHVTSVKRSFSSAFSNEAITKMMIGFINLHNLQLEKLAGEGEVDIFNRCNNFIYVKLPDSDQKNLRSSSIIDITSNAISLSSHGDTPVYKTWANLFDK